ncbi:hypothetical protein LTR62_000589 [Meristemomyces frigidus]|uniref:Kinesin motor domain-containing protein n=1 Tax=Meristemomyces frigidus TaxID=1508187 RepID=A0AAN7YCB7_9PEZI|nr:hypothetical protein LTR62_000589 [Meristemomyces frigidus]
MDEALATATSPPPPVAPDAKSPRPASMAMMMQRHKRDSSRITGSVYSDDDTTAVKTAVKVAVRVRPPLSPSDPGFDLIPQRFRESTCEVPAPNSLHVQSPQGKKLFLFDRVFDENTSQDGIWDYLSESVSSFVQGYNVSVIAYGQSGAGKSYTMGTSGAEDQDDPDIKGIVPRAAQALFERLNGVPVKQHSGLQTPKRYSTQTVPTIASLAKTNGGAKNWELKATYVEIYNEQLRDLLVPENVSHGDRSQVAIREDTKGRILLTGLNQVPVNSVDDLLRALNFGSSIRQTDATAINARSSRSHAVFSLNLVQRKYTDSNGVQTAKQEKRFSVPVDNMAEENVVTIDSKLHFVDLAGSERLKNTGATGDRAKEGININQGLASLGKVISQLSKQGHSHISYRDSRLTRLLQDSLGGNAITFMVACVTPAVFHLSETLNTVTYAQRARAIQSRPEIQQTYEDGDKQAAIERLRSEVSFLRDQLKHIDRPDARDTLSTRSRGREVELRSQLSDMQENYSALSSRHAKLVSELSKARDNDEADTPLLKEAIGEHATERIKRSSSFAQAVEQMVLEYEKTIQSLESSLTKTRSTLSNHENTLLEKETRISYMETIQQQLQARVQKAADREQNNEGYLRDLESRMEGSATGDERNTAMISELRRELARVHESETGAEEYIVTLEERLAEAEQDQEAMQRELDRLEHVVERQRSIGKLDNLLGELDGAHHHGATSTPAPPPPAKNPQQLHTNGVRESYDPFRPRAVTLESNVEDEFEDAASEKMEDHHVAQDHLRSASNCIAPREHDNERELHGHSQTEFMADKVENLTQELLDLREEHETNLVDYENLQQKYQTALETLAKVEYGKEAKNPLETPGQTRPTSFLAAAGMKAEELDGQPSSSRSLSAELSSHGSLNNTEERGNRRPSGISDELSVQHYVTEPELAKTEGSQGVNEEMEMLRRLHFEKEVTVAELSENYKSLAAQHETTLQQLEDMKHEMHRTSHYSYRPASPALTANGWPTSPGLTKPAHRRKSEDMLGSDRASRSLASLKNIALENFEEVPDTRQTFELHLNSVMTELHGRTEKSMALEAELGTLRRELEAKQTLVAGLTRERASLTASSGVDFSVVGRMREQLEESEHQIRSLHQQHASREQEFQGQLDSLKRSLAGHQKAINRKSQLPTPMEERFDHVPGDFPETPGFEIPTMEHSREQAMAGATMSEMDGQRSDEISRLQGDLAAWETRHNDAMLSMKKSEAKLLDTIAELEDSLKSAERSANSARALERPQSPVSPFAPASILASRSIGEERMKHKDIVDALQREIDEHKSVADMHVTKLQQLEESYAGIVKQGEEDAKARDLSEKELLTHQQLVKNLESQLNVHKSTITMHQDTLESLQTNHSKELQDLQNSAAAAEAELKARQAELEEHHGLVIANMQADLVQSQKTMSDLLRNASSALGYETDPTQLHTQIRGLVDEGKELHTRHLKTTNELKAVQEELQDALTHSVSLENKIAELKMLNEETMLNLTKVADKEKKSARLVEELEEQLNNNFDSHQQTNHRLSTFQTETSHVRMELERELEDIKLRNSTLEVSLDAPLLIWNIANNSQQQMSALKRHSLASNASGPAYNRESLSPEAAAIALARSGSQTSVRKSSQGPAPPPSIPLPPLPGTSPSLTATPQMPGIERATSPIQRMTSPERHSRPESHDHSKEASPGMLQVMEEQEARIRTIEKHLFAEKQLTATLEEALVDLETSANRTKSEMDSWRKKCTGLEDELVTLHKAQSNSRASLQAVEEEREMRMRAERARQALEQRMMELNATKKKKKNALNCF